MRSGLIFSILFTTFISFSAEKNSVVEINLMLKELKTEKAIPKKIDLHLKAAEFYTKPDQEQNCKYHLFKAEQLAQTLNDDKISAQVFLKIGDLYYYMSDTPTSITYLNKALLIVGGLNASDQIDCYNKLGILYADVKEFRKSIQAYRKGISLINAAKKITGKEYDRLYNNIALSFMELNLIDSAKLYHKLCLSIRLMKKDKMDLGQTYNNLGSLYYKQNQYDSSLFYYEKGLFYRKTAPEPPVSGIIESNVNIAKAMIALKHYKKAEKILLNALENAKQLIHSSLEYRTTEQLISLYDKTGDFRKAYIYSKVHQKLRDEMYTNETREEAIRLNYAFMYAEKRQHDSLINVQKDLAEKIKLTKEKEITLQKEREVTIIETSLGGLLILMAGIIGLIYRNYKSKKRASETILEQKIEVEKQRDIAEIQKNKIEEIHQEITDSINYAKRIQTAILPSAELINDLLKDYFIFYVPKAIVAGDFYWVYETENDIYFAAGDCTGHGVPGAMVSVVCSNALNRSIVEFGLRIPGEILDKTTDLLIEVFVKSNEQVKDGMDIALCRLDKKTNALSFSGANNPIYIISPKTETSNQEIPHNETHCLLEIKGTKQPVGWRENKINFITYHLPLKKGDSIYLFTDGFADQFGGERGKKYMYKPFQNFILEIQNKSMNEQHTSFQSEFEKWKGNLEQIDDICVIGVKI